MNCDLKKIQMAFCASSFVAWHWKCCNKMKNTDISSNGKKDRL